MKNERKGFPLNDHYPFQFINDSVPHYIFQTDTGVKYEVKFKPSSYIFPSSFPFFDSVFEFSVILAYKQQGNPKIASDQFIPIIVVAIFADFYMRFNDSSITIYTCDSSDYRQRVRKRKFDLWFDEFNDGSFVKINQEIKDLHGTKYPVSIVLKYSNPYRTQVFDAFVSLMNSYNDGK